MRRVAVLGSTGSIGTQTLDVIAQHPDRFQVVALAAGSNEALLQEQAARFGVSKLALHNAPTGSSVPSGIEAISGLATLPEADIVVVSVAGVIGLLPTIAAIKAGKRIALASKEVLVAAGEIVMPLVKKHNAEMVPIDSEHSAIFQCLRGYEPHHIDRIILTASGGPFRGKTRSELENVTVEQTLNHPTWTMGGKITVDSATMMNKGLETIEAKWLFGVGIEQVEVVVHPQSVVHSIVKLKDGSALGQMGWPDMRMPIFVALTHPERVESGLKPWNPVDTPSLTFEPVDHKVFWSIGLAQAASNVGGTMPCLMNAANEEAANAFLRGEINFRQIPEIVTRAMGEYKPQPASLESLLETDARSRAFTRRVIGSSS